MSEDKLTDTLELLSKLRILRRKQDETYNELERAIGRQLMNREGTVSFDIQKYRRLKVRYKAARIAGEEHFEFEGSTLLTNYAYYLCEYLAGVYHDLFPVQRDYPKPEGEA